MGESKKLTCREKAEIAVEIAEKLKEKADNEIFEVLCVVVDLLYGGNVGLTTFGKAV